MRVKVFIRHIGVLQQKPYITFGGNPLRGIKPEHLLYRKGFTAHKNKHSMYKNTKIIVY